MSFPCRINNTLYPQSTHISDSRKSWNNGLSVDFQVYLIFILVVCSPYFLQIKTNSKWKFQNKNGKKIIYIPNTTQTIKEWKKKIEKSKGTNHLPHSHIILPMHILYMTVFPV